MKSRSFKITWTVWILGLLVFVASCQDTMPQRSTITPGSTANELPTCPEGQELVEVSDPASDSSTDTSESEVQSSTDGKTYTCRDKIAVRPDGAVFWKSDFCGCKDGKPVTYGNCSSFCSGKATGGSETLYANFSVSEAISLGGLGNVQAWCKTNIPGDTQNPECELQAKDESGNVIALDVTNPAGTNSITANIAPLSFDKTYVLTLVEKVSRAKSNSVQIIKFSTNTNLSVLGPLKNIPVSQYACIVREFSEDETTGDLYYDSVYRMHLYFIPRIPPKPIPAGNPNYVCHDIFNPLYGLIDQDLYPRFEQLAGVYNLWDNTDPRFYDNNGNGTIDVNEVIVQKTRNFGGTIPIGTSFFLPFAWKSTELVTAENNSTPPSPQPLGFYMAPWIDQTTFKSYCLNSTHYNSSNPLFKAMRDIIGVDTEGLYIGQKAPETVRDSSGNYTTGLSDEILIRETDLKAVWFYLKAGVPTVPNDTTVTNNAVYFYYPLNKASPFVRTSTQRLYRVIFAYELNNRSTGSVSTGGSTSSGSGTSYPPHDRKFGCVPKF